jgi:hypothetical protein
MDPSTQDFAKEEPVGMVEGILAQAVRNRPDDCINHGHGPRPTSARRIVVLETEDNKKFSQGGEQGGTAVTAMRLATPRPRRGVVSCPVLLHVQAEQVAPSEAQVGGPTRLAVHSASICPPATPLPRGKFPTRVPGCPALDRANCGENGRLGVCLSELGVHQGCNRGWKGALSAFANCHIRSVSFCKFYTKTTA